MSPQQATVGTPPDFFQGTNKISLAEIEKTQGFQSSTVRLFEALIPEESLQQARELFFTLPRDREEIRWNAASLYSDLFSRTGQDRLQHELRCWLDYFESVNDVDTDNDVFRSLIALNSLVAGQELDYFDVDLSRRGVEALWKVIENSKFSIETRRLALEVYSSFIKQLKNDDPALGVAPKRLRTGMGLEKGKILMGPFGQDKEELLLDFLSVYSDLIKRFAPISAIVKDEEAALIGCVLQLNLICFNKTPYNELNQEQEFFKVFSYCLRRIATLITAYSSLPTEILDINLTLEISAERFGIRTKGRFISQEICKLLADLSLFPKTIFPLLPLLHDSLTRLFNHVPEWFCTWLSPGMVDFLQFHFVQGIENQEDIKIGKIRDYFQVIRKEDALLQIDSSSRNDLQHTLDGITLPDDLLTAFGGIPLRLNDALHFVRLAGVIAEFLSRFLGKERAEQSQPLGEEPPLQPPMIGPHRVGRSNVEIILSALSFGPSTREIGPMPTNPNETSKPITSNSLNLIIRLGKVVAEFIATREKKAEVDAADERLGKLIK